MCFVQFKVTTARFMRTKLSKTKNKIIHVAKSLFSEMSVYKATMNDIAQAANMSRRTLYMHFKSKEEIYHYVVEDHVKDINEKLQKAADSALPPDRKLKLYILATYFFSFFNFFLLFFSFINILFKTHVYYTTRLLFFKALFTM